MVQSKITLKNLLNIFDGVLRFNKSVIFLTTNHINKIDPALIRPGRMMFKIHLREINFEDSKKLISYKNPEIDLEDENLLYYLQNVKMMPCKLEQITDISRNANEMIKYIKEYMK
jgi:ATP-dependent 26S proteasome regulatory subunit